ncbi:RNA 2',3'-cyclic phosphodiesterase [Mycoplasmatota bacterium WC44]
MRVFIAIEFSDEIKNYLKQVQEIIKLGTKKGNFTIYDNFHVTLKYIGQVDDKGLDDLCDLIDTVASKVEPFDIKLGDIGLFKSRNSNIIWQGIVDGKKELNNLYNLIESYIEEYGFEKEERKYKPHITLARQAIFNESSALESIPLLTDKIKVDKITLMLSARENGILKYTPLYRKDF